MFYLYSDSKIVISGLNRSHKKGLFDHIIDLN